MLHCSILSRTLYGYSVNIVEKNTKRCSSAIVDNCLVRPLSSGDPFVYSQMLMFPSSLFFFFLFFFFFFFFHTIIFRSIPTNSNFFFRCWWPETPTESEFPHRTAYTSTYSNKLHMGNDDIFIWSSLHASGTSHNLSTRLKILHFNYKLCVYAQILYTILSSKSLNRTIRQG